MTRQEQPGPVPRTRSRLTEIPDGVERNRTDALLTVKYLMLFRVGLATLLLAIVVGAAFLQGRPEALGGPFLRFSFALIAATYAATLAYAVAFGRVRDVIGFGYLQVVIDLGIATLLVHATGGAQSAFVFLYFIPVVAVALIAQRRGATVVSMAAAGLMIMVSMGGYQGLLPLVPGQTVLPWDVNENELWFRLALNSAALMGVGILATMLATQTRQAGERLTRHELYAGDLAAFNENVIRCLSSGLLTIDHEGIITSVNDAACEILGQSRLQLRGRPLGDGIPALLGITEDAHPASTVRRAEVDTVRPDGTQQHLGVSLGPLTDHAGNVIGRVVHFQDLTELRKMENAVERAQRLATVGRLASGIAHEIRNPLASISGSIEILRSSPGTDDDSRRLIDIAVREVDRLNRLITELLDFARPPKEERARLRLAEHAAEIVEAFAAEARERGIEIKLEQRADVEIDAAAGQLRQVLWNLLRNAADAIAPRAAGPAAASGTITVRIAREPARMMLDAEHEPGAPAEEAVLSVSDTGAGIPERNRERIFEPFFSTKAGGTGLGLAVVARIVEDHQGRVDLDSELGRGTTFSLRFPLAGTKLRNFERIEITPLPEH